MDDGFAVGFDAAGAFDWARTWGGAGYDQAWMALERPGGGIVATGFFAGTVDFDPGPGTDEHTAPGMGSAVFVTAFDP